MRRAVIAVVVLAALAAAPAAVAKEITSVKICGADGCVTTEDSTLLQGMMSGAGAGSAPRHPSGAISLRSRITEPGGKVIGRISNWWVPGTQLIVAEDGNWWTLPAGAVVVLEKVSAELHPYSPDRLGARFAGTASNAAPSPPVRPAPATARGDGEGGIDWLLVGGLCALAAVAATGLALLRRRPGGATP
jgi:hypothetical protein